MKNFKIILYTIVKWRVNIKREGKRARELIRKPSEDEMEVNEMKEEEEKIK